MLSAAMARRMEMQMWRKALALIATMITAASFDVNSITAQPRVVTSDATAQFVPLEVNKFITIELPAEAGNVVVANPAIANVVPHTTRRFVILGTGAGQTNIAFYDTAGRAIVALDVTVHSYPVPAPSPPGPERVLIVFRGRLGWTHLSCTDTSNLAQNAACYLREDSSATLDSLPPGSAVTMPVGKK
jgi:hypothetical protein